jgi:hypothetical protein
MPREVLKGYAAVLSDGKLVSLDPGPLPEDTSRDVISQLRKMGVLESTSESSDAVPEGAPDPATADVAELAAFIDSNDLNAAQTVALAGGTSEGAAKVLEAEREASGGDGRKTVVEPLTRLAEG